MTAPYVRVYDFTAGQRARSAEVDDEFNAIATGMIALSAGMHDVGTATVPVSDNAIVLTHDPVRTLAYATGDSIVFQAVASTTGAVTVDADSLGVKAIVGVDGSPLASGAIVSGTFYEARYNGTAFQLMNTDPALASDVTQVQGTSTDDPTAPGTFNATLPWRNNEGSPADLASIGFAGIDLRIVNVVHGGDILFLAEDASGVAQALLRFDPDAVESVFTNVDTDVFAGPSVRLHREPAGAEAGADDDYIGEVLFSGMDDAGTPVSVDYARIFARILDATAASNDGQLELAVMVDDVLTTILLLDPAGITVTGDLAISGSLTGTDLDLDAGTDVLVEMGLRNTTGGLLLQVDAATGLAHIAQQSGAGADEKDWLTLARNGAVSLFFNGGVKLATVTGGVDVTGDLDVTSLLTVGDDVDVDQGADALIEVGLRNTIGGLLFQVDPTTGLAHIAQQSGAGADEEDWITLARDGSVSLFDNGSVRLATKSSGINITGSELDLNVGANALGEVGLRNTSGGLLFQVDPTTGLAHIAQQSNTGNDEEDWLTLARNGAVSLFFNGAVRLATKSSGIDVTGTDLDLNVGTNSLTEVGLRNSVGGLLFQVDPTTGLAHISQQDSAGTDEEDWITLARGGAVTLFFGDSAKLATLTGGVDITGTLDVSAGADITGILDVSGLLSANGSIEIPTGETLEGFTGEEWLKDSGGDTMDPLAHAGRHLQGGSDEITELIVDKFESSEITITSQADAAVVHGLGGAPDIMQVWIRCGTANLGFAAGDEVLIEAGMGSGTAHVGMQLSVLSGNITEIYHTQGFNTPLVADKTSGVVSAITAGSWKFFIRAYRFRATA